MRLAVSSVIVLLSLGSAATASAQSFDLSFASLPSAQGFTYAAAGGGAALAESDVFSVDGSRLYQDTLGIDTTVGGGNYYFRGVTLGATGNFAVTADVTLRAFEGQVVGGGTTYPFGLSFGLANTYVAIAGERLASYSAGQGVRYYDFPTGFSPLGSHSYRLSRIGGLVSLTADGTTVFSQALSGVGATDQLLLGDGTGFANASGYFSRFAFSTGVPEPATWALMILGFGAVAGAIRRRGRTTVPAMT